MPSWGTKAHTGDDGWMGVHRWEVGAWVGQVVRRRGGRGTRLIWSVPL